jgi:hypothetical protein
MGLIEGVFPLIRERGRQERGQTGVTPLFLSDASTGRTVRMFCEKNITDISGTIRPFFVSNKL